MNSTAIPTTLSHFALVPKSILDLLPPHEFPQGTFDKVPFRLLWETQPMISNLFKETVVCKFALLKHLKQALKEIIIRCQRKFFTTHGTVYFRVIALTTHLNLPFRPTHPLHTISSTTHAAPVTRQLINPILQINPRQVARQVTKRMVVLQVLIR